MSDSSDEDEIPVEKWISWFLRQPAHRWMVEVDASFIEDAFNLYGLKQEIGHSFKECIETMLGPAPTETGEGERAHVRSKVYPHAKNLYGLIHARFILTSRGVQLMTEKYERKVFGRCPRTLCQGTPVLPLGPSPLLGHHRVKVFCPRCEDVYSPHCPPQPRSSSSSKRAREQERRRRRRLRRETAGTGTASAEGKEGEGGGATAEGNAAKRRKLSDESSDTSDLNDDDDDDWDSDDSSDEEDDDEEDEEEEEDEGEREEQHYVLTLDDGGAAAKTLAGTAHPVLFFASKAAAAEQEEEEERKRRFGLGGGGGDGSSSSGSAASSSSTSGGSSGSSSNSGAGAATTSAAKRFPSQTEQKKLFAAERHRRENAVGPFSLESVRRTWHPACLDGAYFGPSFPHSLLMSLYRPNALNPSPPMPTNPPQPAKTLDTYVPRIYGFRVHNQRGRLPLALGDSGGAYSTAQVKAVLASNSRLAGTSSDGSGSFPMAQLVADPPLPEGKQQQLGISNISNNNTDSGEKAVASSASGSAPPPLAPAAPPGTTSSSSSSAPVLGAGVAGGLQPPTEMPPARPSYSFVYQPAYLTSLFPHHHQQGQQQQHHQGQKGRSPAMEVEGGEEDDPRDIATASGGGSGASGGSKAANPKVKAPLGGGRDLTLHPLTKPYPDWKRPIDDDFHSSSDDNGKSQCGPAEPKKTASKAGGTGAGGAGGGSKAASEQQVRRT